LRRFRTAGTAPGPGVCTDVDLFRRRVKYAAHQPPLVAIEVLDGALDMVTGPPGTVDGTLRSWCRWVDSEMLHARWEDIVVDAAHALARLCLAHDDPDGARRAAERGRKASPLNGMVVGDEMKPRRSQATTIERGCEAVEQLAREHGVDLRPLYGRQDLAFAASLPLGLGVGRLVTR
jgi:hypothetical protein